MASSDIWLNRIENATRAGDNADESELRQQELQLMQKIRDGDEEAFLSLYRRYSRGIHRFVIRLTESASHAEDILQEVFLALISKPEQYDPARGNLSNYLFGIAHKQVLRHREKQKGQAPLPIPDDELAAGEGFEFQEDFLGRLSREQDFAKLHEAISSLPYHYRETVVLCDLEEKSYADAAGILNCPIGTIRSRLSRAHLLLLERMQAKKGETLSRVDEAGGKS